MFLIKTSNEYIHGTNIRSQFTVKNHVSFSYQPVKLNLAPQANISLSVSDARYTLRHHCSHNHWKINLSYQYICWVSYEDILEIYSYLSTPVFVSFVKNWFQEVKNLNVGISFSSLYEHSQVQLCIQLLLTPFELLNAPKESGVWVKIIAWLSTSKDREEPKQHKDRGIVWKASAGQQRRPQTAGKYRQFYF